MHGVPHFEGKEGESLSAFLLKVETAAKIGSWDPDYHCAQLILLLGGRAFKFVEGLSKEKTESLPALIEALYASFLGPGAQKDAREELRILRRRAQEKPEDFGQRIQDLARIAFPGNMQQQEEEGMACLLYTSPSPRDQRGSRMPSSA